MEKTIKKKELITDIAGNLFLIIEYEDIDGKKKTEIKPYDPDELILKKINEYKTYHLYK